MVKKYKEEEESLKSARSARTQKIDEKAFLLSEIEKKNQEIKNLKREETNLYWQIEREVFIFNKVYLIIRLNRK